MTFPETFSLEHDVEVFAQQPARGRWGLFPVGTPANLFERPDGSFELFVNHSPVDPTTCFLAFIDGEALGDALRAKLRDFRVNLADLDLTDHQVVGSISTEQGGQQ